jgi:hypothetical protein
MAKRLIPLLDRVLVEKIVAPTKSVGGILLPESAVSKINEAKVVAVGPGRRTGKDGELIPMGRSFSVLNRQNDRPFSRLPNPSKSFHKAHLF